MNQQIYSQNKYRSYTLFSILFIVAFLLMYFSPSAQAITLNCQPAEGAMPVNTIPLNLSTYVGNEIPIGTIIYQLDSSTGSNLITCRSSDPMSSLITPIYSSISNAPLGPPLMVGARYVFPTNVSGVGVAFEGITPVLNGATTQLSMSPSLIHSWDIFAGNIVLPTTSTTKKVIDHIKVYLIKTGPIASGSLVNASMFPTIKYFVDRPTNANIVATDLPLTKWTVNFTGAMQFITATCVTPDYNVNMGSYNITDRFRGINSTTPWIDASITLQNCPIFNGRHGNDSTMQKSTNGDMPTGNNRIASLISVSLSPTTTIINGSQGVMAINSEGTGGTAATGIGLQLGYTPNNINANATSPSRVWTNGSTWNLTLPSDGSRIFKIPLAARYYQTATTVTPGPANTKMIFTINYQ